MQQTTLDVAMNLMARVSVTPEDAGCQAYLASLLKPLGFKTLTLPCEEVENCFISFGEGAPFFVFAGHTDVVPSGPVEKWRFPPFTPTIHDGQLYGRGAADMKGSVAAMTMALMQFIQKHPNFKGSVGLLLTSDEEGPGIHGTKYVMEVLQEKKIKLDACLVGEPSSENHFADIIKIGRRGSLHAHVTFLGKQGHVAYPDKASNAIHLGMPALLKLIQEKWDEGNQHFPPTTMQIPNLNAGTGAGNVIPGEMKAQINWRFSPELTVEAIQERVIAIFANLNLKYHIEWEISGLPFITHPGKLLDSVQAALAEQNIHPTLATHGGTSDARYIAPYGTEVLELGPNNTTIHQIDECVPVAELEKLTAVYCRILELYFQMPN